MKKSIVFFFLVLSSCSGGSSNSQTNNSYVLRWNQIAIDSSGIDHQSEAAGEQLGPTKASRAMAIVHIAMFESLNTISPNFQSYLGLNAIQNRLSQSMIEQVQDAIPELALAQAARDALAYLYPSQTARFDSFLDEEKARFAEEPIEIINTSLAIGSSVASEIIRLRTNDRSELSTDLNESLYEFSSLPGRWRPDPFNPQLLPLGTQWGLVTPFVLKSSDQFRAPPPPALTSAEYAEAYAETFRLGGDGIQTPTERSEEETIIGIFWAYDGTPSLCAPPRLYNQLTRALISSYGPGEALETARLLALVNTAMGDAAISIWEAKYFYDFWRPVTAIQESDPGTGPSGIGDGNSLTPGDVNFKPLGSPASNLFENNFTPPFPTYPSGHAGFGGALFETLRRYYGSDELPFSFVSDEFNGETRDSQGNPRPIVERSFETLSEAEEENGQSRIYLGIHFGFDKTSAIEQGRKVGSAISDQLFLPIQN
jgi:hypothetical protein